MDLSTVKADQREDVRDDKSQPRPYLTAEELGRPEHIHMDTDKLSPGRGLLALGGWGDPMAFQDIPHGLVADAIAQVCQGTHNAVILPRAILSGHAHHKVFQCLIKAGTSNRFARLHVMTRLGDERTVPSEDRVRVRNDGDFCQGLLPKLLTKLSEDLTLCVSEMHPACDLVAYDAVFRH
jgi:hypothetical protein